MQLDTELDAEALRELTARFQAMFDFPPDARDQLRQQRHHLATVADAEAACAAALAAQAAAGDEPASPGDPEPER